MKKVLIPTKLDRVAQDLLTANGHYIVVQQETTDVPALAAQHPDTHALIVRSEKVTLEVLDLLPQLKLVVRAGSGFDTIHTKHARKKGVDVMTTPGANANAVAEEVLALMLADARHIVPAEQMAQERADYGKQQSHSETGGINKRFHSASLKL